MDKITLGGGCFWCVEGAFKMLKGVQSAVSGYTQGHTTNPTYKEICTGTTGHVEAVQVTFDPAQISLTELLDVFWTIHDPTTLNRQGNDVGTQYRSGIYFHEAGQLPVIQQSIEESAKPLWGNQIVTEVKESAVLYPAEAYHQDYFLNNPNQPYCTYIINPKIQKVRSKFLHLIHTNYAK